MQIDYERLASIATDLTSRSTMAKDTSEVLASYLQILSNLIYAAERLSESEMAMIISSLNRWVTKKDITVNRLHIPPQRYIDSAPNGITISGHSVLLSAPSGMI